LTRCDTIRFVAGLFTTLLDDLTAESAALGEVLESLDAETWDAPTACHPWTIKDQVSHLAWNDDSTVLALTHPDEFRRTRPHTPEGIQQMVDGVMTEHHHRDASDLLSWFLSSRSALIDAASAADPKLRMPWYGPDMSVTSKLTARFMETWAHARDITEALGLADVRTDRIRHVVFLGLQAMPNAFATNGLPPPACAVRLEVVAPSGELWLFGPPETADVVRGDAHELALLVTQRVHLVDTALRAEGDVARQWLRIAQAFAGPPGRGRAPQNGAHAGVSHSAPERGERR
jgi:uncharacterized protein (TIGR03084 family)